MSESKEQPKKEMRMEVVTVNGHFYHPITFEEIHPNNGMRFNLELNLTPEALAQVMPSLREHCRQMNFSDEDIASFLTISAAKSASTPAQQDGQSSSGSDEPMVKIFIEPKTDDNQKN